MAALATSPDAGLEIARQLQANCERPFGELFRARLAGDEARLLVGDQTVEDGRGVVDGGRGRGHRPPMCLTDCSV